jgi:hypothetical protein
MTKENLHHLARNNNLGQEPGFAGYCLVGAIDSCFERTNVPMVVHKPNYAAFANNEVGKDGEGLERLYQLPGQLAFKDKDPKTLYLRHIISLLWMSYAPIFSN